jgi:DNA-binding CsgD family transcriptional regulator
MSKSERVTAAQELAVVRLVNECRDLGDDSAAWQGRLADGLVRLTGGLVASVGATPPHRGTAALGDWAGHNIGRGWPSAAVEARFRSWQAHPERFATHPATGAFFARPDPHLTLTRRELVDDRTWDRSSFVNTHLRPDGLDEGLSSKSAVALFASSYLITVMRPVRESPFRPGVARLVAATQRELAPHLGRGLLLTTQPSKYGLTPRLRQVLDCLLDGDSEKQAALRLRLHTATVHEHVKRLYRHFGVNTRAELMAYFLRRYRRGS